LGQESYGQWTKPFSEGSRFEGSWEAGQTIRFYGPSSEEGLQSVVAENRPGEFVSLRHIGMVYNGVLDTESDAARRWSPQYENYTFRTCPEGTELQIDQETDELCAAMMREMWPKALAELKALCEAG
jgi:hypothetical protein